MPDTVLILRITIDFLTISVNDTTSAETDIEGQILKRAILECIKEDIVCLSVHDAVAGK